MSERERGDGAPDQPPEQTKDDTDVGWGETTDPEAARDEHERWLQEQRPPHWD